MGVLRGLLGGLRGLTRGARTAFNAPGGIGSRLQGIANAKFVNNPGLKAQIPYQVGVGVLGWMAGGTPEEKVSNVAINAGSWYLTMGMRSAYSQLFWSMAISMVPALPGIFTGIADGYRGALESRTTASVPLAHSTIQMDQAFASLQYAKQRMGGAYASVGNEAAFFASRLLRR